LKTSPNKVSVYDGNSGTGMCVVTLLKEYREDRFEDDLRELAYDQLKKYSKRD